MAAPQDIRILILGKRDSLKNDAVKVLSQGVATTGKSFKFIKTPGIYATKHSDELKEEVSSCLSECEPGLHAFIVVMEMEPYTEESKNMMKKVSQFFSDEALENTIVLFISGEPIAALKEKIDENQQLKGDVEKCKGGVCRIDKKCWKEENKEVLEALDHVIEARGGRCYRARALDEINRVIDEEAKKTNEENADEKAKETVIDNLVKIARSLQENTLGAIYEGDKPLGNIIQACKIQ